MKCDCGYKAFYYQKFDGSKKWDVYKCGHVMIESKKKTKCDMNVCEYVCDMSSCPKTGKPEVYVEEKKIDPERVYRDLLRKYIYLCEITQMSPKKYRWGYVANINYLLKKFNFNLYFEETETLESLKQRIKNKYVHRILEKTNFPIKLTDYPEYLSVITEKKQTVTETVNKKKKPKPAKKKKKTETVKKQEFLLPTEEPTEEQNKPAEEPLHSDAESDSEDGGDNTFDIDKCDSEDDYEDVDDSGAFSD